MGRFRFRKGIPIIPGFLRLNASGSAGGGKRSGGTSWTIHFGKLISYNTRTGGTSINPPGPGSWQSSPRSTRKKAKERKKALKAADQAYWRQYAEDVKAGREPDMRGAPSRRGPNGQLPRKRRVAAQSSKPQGSGRAPRRSTSTRDRAAPVQPAAPHQGAASNGSSSGHFYIGPGESLRGPVYVWGGRGRFDARDVCLAGPFNDNKDAQWWLNEHYVDAAMTLREWETGTLRPTDSGPPLECPTCGADIGLMSRTCRKCGTQGVPRGEAEERNVSALDAAGLSQEEYNRLSMAERQQVQRSAGNCGAPTKDGTPCLNSSNCPVPSHRGLGALL